jgi:hypothetical protein
LLAFPDIPDDTNLDKPAAALARYQAELAAHQKRLDARAATATAVKDAEEESFSAYAEAIIGVAKESVDRARAGAEIVQKSAAAIAGLYTGVLGFSFSVTEQPFPSRGLAPLVLLGLAIVLSTAYLSYLTRGRAFAGAFDPSSVARVNTTRRLNGFVDWTRAIVGRQSYLLRASVIALALSLPFLASPFISIGKVEADKPPGELTAWPSPADLGDAKLSQLRYAAEVKEVADIRAKQIAAAGSKTVVRDNTDDWWWKALILAVALSFFGPFIIEGLQSTLGQDRDSDSKRSRPGVPLPRKGR